MTPWTKSMSLVALALGCGMTIATTNARAEEAEETVESTEAIVNDTNDDLHLASITEITENRLVVDNDSHRRDYRSCYSYCDDQRDDCMRRYYRGYDNWHRGDRRRWDDRHRGHEGYRRCERRFDYCLEACRDRRDH